MRVNWLAVQDFRNYESARLELAPEGLTVVIGENGQGKTNLVEAIGYLATLSSHRVSITSVGTYGCREKCGNLRRTMGVKFIRFVRLRS